MPLDEPVEPEDAEVVAAAEVVIDPAAELLPKPEPADVVIVAKVVDGLNEPAALDGPATAEVLELQPLLPPQLYEWPLPPP